MSSAVAEMTRPGPVPARVVEFPHPPGPRAGRGSRLLPSRLLSSRRLGSGLLACGLCMAPWLVVLAVTLPATTRVPHWSAAWVALDALEAIGLAVTGWLVRRGDPRRCLTATGTAALLVADALFDVATAGSGGPLAEAIIMAACAEIPMATLLVVLACRALPTSTAGQSR